VERRLTHIVTLGSGTGQATLLRGLRATPYRITAVVGVTDNGGHSGLLRRTLRIPQVGDTRQCLGALVDDQSLWGRLLQHRFTGGDLRGLSVGNLILAALTDLHGSLQAAVDEVRRAAGIAWRVLPVCDADTHIAAEFEDGRKVVGEWQIMQRQPCATATRVFLQPQVPANPAVLEAIADADVVVACPGSLLTGTLAVLLPTGVREALGASRAKCLYVCNLMTQPGQTAGWSAARHLAVLQRYLGRQVDAVLLNNGTIPAALLQLYATHGSYPVGDDLTEAAVPVYRADLVERPDAETLRAYRRPQGAGMQVGLHLIRHDADRLVARILALVANWQGGKKA
jgi:uncharacterized cofD-like protein